MELSLKILSVDWFKLPNAYELEKRVVLDFWIYFFKSIWDDCRLFYNLVYYIFYIFYEVFIFE